MNAVDDWFLKGYDDAMRYRAYVMWDAELGDPEAFGSGGRQGFNEMVIKRGFMDVAAAQSWAIEKLTALDGAVNLGAVIDTIDRADDIVKTRVAVIGSHGTITWEDD